MGLEKYNTKTQRHEDRLLCVLESLCNPLEVLKEVHSNPAQLAAGF